MFMRLFHSKCQRLFLCYTAKRCYNKVERGAGITLFELFYVTNNHSVLPVIRREVTITLLHPLLHCSPIRYNRVYMY